MISIAISKLHKKITVRAIFRKICNLRNFVFYNFSKNLGFQQLEKDFTTLQLLRILHGIINNNNIKVFRRITARLIFNRIWILRNLAFYNFFENLYYQSKEEGWTTLRLLLVSPSIITVSTLQKKYAVRVISRKFRNLWNFAFYKFSKNLGFQSWEEGWTTLLLLLISRCIFTISKFHKKFQLGLFWEKFVICEISHFTTFPRILVFST